MARHAFVALPTALPSSPQRPAFARSARFRVPAPADSLLPFEAALQLDLAICSVPISRTAADTSIRGGFSRNTSFSRRGSIARLAY